MCQVAHDGACYAHGCRAQAVCYMLMHVGHLVLMCVGRVMLMCWLQDGTGKALLRERARADEAEAERDRLMTGRTQGGQGVE